MKLDAMPGPESALVIPSQQTPTDDAQKRAIADAVWSDLLWLMPPDRAVTVIVRDGRVGVELGPPDREDPAN